MRATRSMLYIPADSPGMLQHAPVFGCDSILMDLEDAIAYTEKDSARRMAVWFLKEFDFKELFVTVLTNGADTKFFEDDIEAVIPCRPGAVRLPKCNSEEDIRYADEKISAVEMKNGMEIGTVKLHAMVETALGLENAFRIASASPRVTALTLGGQDFTADMGIQKTREGRELFYARGRIVAAAHAAGVASFDTVWTDLNDQEGLFLEAKEIVELGFTGKACIHPSQIATIHRAFMPAEKDLRKALRVVEAAEKAEREGKGVISVDGKMVDAPIVARSAHLLKLAELYGFDREAL